MPTLMYSGQDIAKIIQFTTLVDRTLFSVLEDVDDSDENQVFVDGSIIEYWVTIPHRHCDLFETLLKQIVSVDISYSYRYCASDYQEIIVVKYVLREEV